ncbi:PhnA domain-containing protein [Micrococcus luteus]|uniref:PhnA domain-containing protein n=1 Tax=Micrococcus luteus TaxID=1270 RepID=UPI0030168428
MEAVSATDALPPRPSLRVCVRPHAGDGEREVHGGGAEQQAAGDDVTIAKDLKVKGGAGIKSGTKVRGIRLPGCRLTATTPRRRPRVWVSCT